MAPGTVLAGRVVLVTGASGFLGSHVAQSLIGAGAQVHALVRRGSTLGRLQRPPAVAAVWPGDVTDPESVLRCFQGSMPAYVVHLAGDTGVRRFNGDWTTVERSVAVNVGGTLNVLRGAVLSGAPISTLLRVGGLEEYGTGPVPFDETQREAPTSPYSASQVAACHYSQVLQRHVAFDIVTLRPALVYGPGQSDDFLIPGLIRSCLRRTPFDMTGGDQRRDLLYVDDFVDAVLRALGTPALRGAVINVASGREVPVRQVAEMIVRLAGTPGILRVGTAAGRPGDLAHLVARTARAESVLGWRAATDLTEGLKRTIDWYRTAEAEAS